MRIGTGRAAGLIVFVLVLVAAWLASPELPSPMRLLAVTLSTVLPALMLVQTRLASEIPEGVSRISVYLSSSATLWLLAGITLLAVLASAYPLAEIGLTDPGLGALIGWSAAASTVGVAWIALWRALPVEETDLLRFLLPRTSGEKAAFAGVSVTAGICEELVFRGFLIASLAMMTGSLTGAVVASSVIFGILHAYQGWIGIARTASLGVLLAVPLVATGSVLPSMVAHAAINIVVGLFLARWLLREPHPVEVEA